MSVSSLQATPDEGVSRPTPKRSRLKAGWFENDQIADGLDFGLATDRSSLEQAFRLQHDQYVAQGYMDPHPSNWRLSIHNALPATRVFVARSKDRVVATMTLIADSPVGLPMDEIYADELRRLRDLGRDLAEVSGLAMDPDYQASGVAVLLRLVRMLVVYAAQVESDLCIAVNPRHCAFYRKAFHFQDIGGLKQYRSQRASCRCACLDLCLARSLIRELRDGHPMISEVHGFLFSPENLGPVLARLNEDLKHVVPLAEHVKYFFSRHEALTNASAADRAYILAGCNPKADHKPSHASAGHAKPMRFRPGKTPVSGARVVVVAGLASRSRG
jgi:hypothetical protein